MHALDAPALSAVQILGNYDVTAMWFGNIFVLRYMVYCPDLFSRIARCFVYDEDDDEATTTSILCKRYPESGMLKITENIVCSLPGGCLYVYMIIMM